MKLQSGLRHNARLSSGLGARECIDRSCSSRPCRLCCKSVNGASDLEKSGRHQCGLLEAAKYARQDAMLVTAAAQNMDEKARSDLLILAREFSRLDMRARQDMALIGSTVSRLDARARERAHRKVDRFGRMATKLKELAGTELKVAATEHWNDGGLEADLRLADLRARRRAMEDSFATFQAVKNIHNAAVKVLLMKQKGQALEFVPGNEQRSARDNQTITEFEEAYSKMASLLAEVNGLEHSDPDELEFIIATLLDMDEVHGASGASLVTESASSPDIATRRALVDALANAPSLLALGNAGIGALQRLAEDENLEVSQAASNALDELQSEWKHIDASMLSSKIDIGENYENYLDEKSLMEEPEED